MSPGRERLCPLSAGHVWDRVVAMRVFSDVPFFRALWSAGRRLPGSGLLSAISQEDSRIAEWLKLTGTSGCHLV